MRYRVDTIHFTEATGILPPTPTIVRGKEDKVICICPDPTQAQKISNLLNETSRSQGASMDIGKDGGWHD